VKAYYENPNIALETLPRENAGMGHRFSTSYLEDSISLFRHYKKLAERALEQCPDEGLFATLDNESNSIAVIIKHVAGNARSRWTDFLTSDGEKPTRNRDNEFEEPPKTRLELLATWEEGWKCLFEALTAMTDADLHRVVTIRGEEHSAMQAINRQMGHYSYHLGQIVFLAKHFAAQSGKWIAVTIPRRQSAKFTADVAAGKLSQR
jgi:Protein of unknown function (DUF1572)